MKEFCIEITPAQPLDKVEAKLKEMGYEPFTSNWTNDVTFIATRSGGRYSTHLFDHSEEPMQFKTLDEL